MRVIARVFPSYQKMARRFAEAEQLGPDLMPFGRYPNDELTYKSPQTVEYKTPPHRDGLGSALGIQGDTQPIGGVAMLMQRGDPPGPAGGTSLPDLILLAVRLPRDLAHLAPMIVRQTELDAKKRPQ